MERAFRIASRGRPRHNRSRNSLAGFLLLLFCIGVPTRSRGSELQQAPSPSAGPGVPFAIADLDGDQRPDLATIETGQTNSPATNDYWVQLRLSAVKPASFRLVAPQGGLLIEVRDVNGDHALDLVLSTAWRRNPVAILLNDGHGNFSRVEPAAYPAAFNQPCQNWAVRSAQETCAIASAPESRTDFCLKVESLQDINLIAGPAPGQSSTLAFWRFSLPHAGRGPPRHAPRS